MRDNPVFDNHTSYPDDAGAGLSDFEKWISLSFEMAMA